MSKIQKPLCIYCADPWWAGASGLSRLLQERYQFLCRIFESVDVLFITPTSMRCPYPGATVRIPRRLQYDDILAIRTWCERRNIEIHYAFLDKLAGILEHMSGLKLCEISDVFHLRDAALAEFGYAEQSGRTKRAELESMRAYDFVLALNPDEVNYLRNNGVSHAVQLLPNAAFNKIVAIPGASQTGMLGAMNTPNRDGLAQLGSLLEHVDSFVLGGRICDSLEDSGLAVAKVTSMGFLAHTRDFYRSVQTVLSPIRFGAGLKIKVLEAVSAGKPLVATEHSIAGFPNGIHEVALVDDEPASWTNAQVEAAMAMHDPERQSGYINEYFSDEALRRKLEQLL